MGERVLGFNEEFTKAPKTGLKPFHIKRNRDEVTGELKLYNVVSSKVANMLIHNDIGIPYTVSDLCLRRPSMIFLSMVLERLVLDETVQSDPNKYFDLGCKYNIADMVEVLLNRYISGDEDVIPPTENLINNLIEYDAILKDGNFKVGRLNRYYKEFTVEEVLRSLKGDTGTVKKTVERIINCTVLSAFKWVWDNTDYAESTNYKASYMGEQCNVLCTYDGEFGLTTWFENKAKKASKETRRLFDEVARSGIKDVKSVPLDTVSFLIYYEGDDERSKMLNAEYTFLHDSCESYTIGSREEEIDALKYIYKLSSDYIYVKREIKEGGVKLDSSLVFGGYLRRASKTADLTFTRDYYTPEEVFLYRVLALGGFPIANISDDYCPFAFCKDVTGISVPNIILTFINKVIVLNERGKKLEGKELAELKAYIRFIISSLSNNRKNLLEYIQNHNHTCRALSVHTGKGVEDALDILQLRLSECLYDGIPSLLDYLKEVMYFLNEENYLDEDGIMHKFRTESIITLAINSSFTKWMTENTEITAYSKGVLHHEIGDVVWVDVSRECTKRLANDINALYQVEEFDQTLLASISCIGVDFTGDSDNPIGRVFAVAPNRVSMEESKILYNTLNLE